MTVSLSTSISIISASYRPSKFGHQICSVGAADGMHQLTN